MVQEILEVKVFLLAGGPGSRLFPFTTFTPKPLMPVAGKPVIVRAMEKLNSEGFTDFVLCVNQNFADLFEYHMEMWKNASGTSVAISACEKSEDLGTAGEVLIARKYIDGDFMVYYGDILAPGLSLKGLVKFFERCKREHPKDLVGTLAIAKGLVVEKGVVEMDGFNIRALREKPVLNIANWSGIGIFTPKILRYMKIGDDFSRHVLPRLLETGKKLTAFVFSEPYYDIGSIGSYRKVNEFFRNDKTVLLNSYV